MACLVVPMQRCSLQPRHIQTASILAPFLQQTRSSSILASLSDVKGAYNKRIRRGRGPSSGKGKTSGRGHKGQKQHGKVPTGFNGGQTPLEVVHGVRGFTNQFSLEMTTINLDRIQQWIDAGRIDPSKPITVRELQSSRCTHGIKDGIKLLARDASSLRTPINITVSRASKAAITAIEAAGGTIQTRYYTRAAIRRVLKGDTHPTVSLLSAPAQIQALSASSVGVPGGIPNTGAASPVTPNINPAANSSTALVLGLKPTSHYKYRLPDATSRKDIEYYRDPAHRGYLSYLLEEGQGPSLFFKTPAEMEELAKRANKIKSGKPGKSAATENLW